MPGLNLEQAIAQRQQHCRSLGRAALLLAGMGWLVVFVIAGVAIWLVAIFANGDGRIAMSWVLIGFACLGSLGTLATMVFYFKPDVDLDVRDESYFDTFTGNRARAGEAMFGCLLVLPLSTADGLRDFTQAGGLPEEEMGLARQIVDELYVRNDWLPLARYQGHFTTVAHLIRLDLINIKEVHGRLLIRLNPSLMP